MIQVGQDVGNYRVASFLGEGGMGRIFVVEHRVIGKRAALKALQPELSRMPEVVARFFTEARAVAKIGHPHIVDISDFGMTDEGEPWFLMELLEGESLSARIAREGHLGPAAIVHVGQQVASALAAAHAQGVLHRDLKSENLFLLRHDDDDLYVKVLDFGLAKLAEGDVIGAGARTQAGIPMGTPWYMSPEQAAGSVTLDERTDIYSLGIILFEMAVGHVPFDGETPMNILVQHATRPRPRPRDLGAALPDELESFILRCMSISRDERPASMEALRGTLLAFRPAVGLAVSETTGVRPNPIALYASPMPGFSSTPRESVPPRPFQTPAPLSHRPSPSAALGLAATHLAADLPIVPASAPPPSGPAISEEEIAEKGLLERGDLTGSAERMDAIDDEAASARRTSSSWLGALLLLGLIGGGSYALDRWAEHRLPSPTPAGEADRLLEAIPARETRVAHSRPPLPAPPRPAPRPSPTLLLQSAPGGAEIYRIYEGKTVLLGLAPLTLELPFEGTETVLVAKKGFPVVRRQLTAADAGQLTVPLVTPRQQAGPKKRGGRRR